MKKNLNAIYFSKGLVNVPKVTVVSDGTESMGATLTPEKMREPDFKIAMAISVELMRFGKILTPEALYGITLLDKESQVKLAVDLKEYLTELYGDGQYVTLFGDYPNTVLSMSSEEMLLHQIVHYWATALGGEYWPNHQVEDSETTRGDGSIKVCCKDKYDFIEVGDADKLSEIVINLVHSQQSLTQWDKDVVYTVYKDIDTIPFSPIAKTALRTAEVPFKETLCLVMSACPSAACIKDINDVLRVAMFLSGGDISLAPIPKIKDYGWKKEKMTKADKKPWNFKNFNNTESKMLLDNIDSIAKTKGQHAVEDMKKYALRWVRLGEKLHPGSEKNSKRWPNAAWAFSIVRNSIDKVETFGTRIEAAKSKRDLGKILALLKTRPGEFARQLDWILRTFTENQSMTSVENRIAVATAFKEVVDKVSTKVLYEITDHFYARTLGDTDRTVFPKGARKPIQIQTLAAMSSDSAYEIINAAVAELVKRMAQKEDLVGKKVILDEDLKDIMIPKNMRSVNAGVKQLARGTKTHIPTGASLLRFYLFWEDETGGEDLDLHCRFFDENFGMISYISWDGNYKLYNNLSRQYAQFSGDVRHHRGKCAEYIDVDIQEAINDGARYLVADARDFNAHSFRNAYCGMMARSTWGTPGELSWAPSTVENGFKIASTTQTCVLCIIDLAERKMIYVDEDITGAPRTTYDTETVIGQILKRYVEGHTKAFFNAQSVIQMYYTACGAEVNVLEHKLYLTTKESVEAQIKLFKELSGENKPKEIQDTLDTKIEELEKYVFVGFDEISEDYAKLFNYMF